MYAVVCENREGEPDIFAPFESAEQAQTWIDSFNNNGDTCPNDHYWLEVMTPIMRDNDGNERDPYEVYGTPEHEALLIEEERGR